MLFFSIRKPTHKFQSLHRWSAATPTVLLLAVEMNMTKSFFNYVELPKCSPTCKKLIKNQVPLCYNMKDAILTGKFQEINF